jgi:hypothetical protein
MSKKLLVGVLALFLAIAGMTPAYAHDSANGDGHRFHLRPASVDMQRSWVRWALGSTDAPFLTPGDCGRAIHGIF